MRRYPVTCGERSPRSRRRPGRSRIARQDFRRWLDTAHRGDTYVYHSGFLMADRCSQVYANGLAGDALGAYHEGRVILMQRRYAAGVYDYIATRL